MEAKRTGDVYGSSLNELIVVEVHAGTAPHDVGHSLGSILVQPGGRVIGCSLHSRDTMRVLICWRIALRIASTWMD